MIVTKIRLLGWEKIFAKFRSDLKKHMSHKSYGSQITYKELNKY